MTATEVAEACRVAHERLTALPPAFHYHDVTHTFRVVLPAARRYARAERLDEREQGLAVVAAAMHDVGFVETYQGHEAAGARLAERTLGEMGVDPEEIAAVTGMILATRLPQRPHNALERIVADADLDVLGRTDFLQLNGLLREELALRGQALSDAEWFGRQVEFLLQHRYFTDSARRARGARKAVNLARLEQLLRRAMLS